MSLRFAEANWLLLLRTTVQTSQGNTFHRSSAAGESEWVASSPFPTWRCCTARSKSLTSLCRLQSHPAQYVSGISSAAILLSISHPIRCSTRCLANVRARISGPMIAL